VKGDGDVVGGADFLGADAPLVDQPCERRRQELEDGRTGAADIAAVAGAAFGLAQRAFEACEALVVLDGAAATLYRHDAPLGQSIFRLGLPYWRHCPA
jgi:hypothetical protein